MQDRTGQVSKKDKRAREYNYKEERDALKRSLNTMITLLRITIWIMAVIAVIGLGVFIRLLFIS